MDNKSLKKNKIDLQYQTLMQERNAILLTLVGMPITVFNLAITIFQLEIFQAVTISFLSFYFLLMLKEGWDKKVKHKIEEIDYLMKK